MNGAEDLLATLGRRSTVKKVRKLKGYLEVLVMSRRVKIKNIHCPNCDYKFREIENFCPNCGQDNHSHKIPLKHYIIEFLEGTIHFDTKVFKTFRLLLFRPGQLTKDYM